MIGKKIREERERRGWSRRELSIHSGYTEQWLGQIERGEANPSLPMMLALERVLGIKLAGLKEEHDEK